MDRPLVRHAHPHCHVLLKVDGANTSFLVGDRIAPLSDETAVLINAWTPHAYVHRPELDRTVILALYIEPSWLAEFRTNWMSSGDAGFFGRSSGEVTPRIRKLSHELASSMVYEPGAIAEHEALLGKLMIAVIERFSDWRGVGDRLRHAARQQSVDWRVRKAMSLIQTAPAEVDGIDRLAASAGMSRANFFRVFERSTGVTPRVFLNVVRLERAVRATVDTDISFTDLSERLGFATPGNFSRFFRDHSGVMPSHFRAISRLAPL